jgi:hypothetical protein
VRRFGDTRAKLGEGVVPGVFGLLASVGEIVAEPENLKGALRKMVDGLRDTLGLRAISISASFGEGRRISATSGMTSETAAEFPILRGKTLIGTFCGYPDALDNGQKEALRAAAGIAALALDAAHAREVAAQKTRRGASSRSPRRRSASSRRRRTSTGPCSCLPWSFWMPPAVRSCSATATW